MKERLILFILCIALLAGVLYWLIPKATTFFKQVDAMGTAIAQPGMPTVTTPTIIATRQVIPTREATPGTTQETATISGLSMESTIWLAGIAVGFLLLVQIVYSLSRRTSLTKYGSAHFARGSELREFQVPLLVSLLSLRNRKKTPESRLVLGKTAIGRTVSLSERQQESNILLTAPVGSGKSSGIIIPNLLRERGSRSLFISDVKGELLRVTGGAVSRYHDVYVFAPTKPQESHGYNPLAAVLTPEDAQDLAQCWISNTGQSQDDFWPNIAKKLMVAVILHLKATEKDAPFSRVADLLCSTSYDDLKATLIGSPSEKAQKETKAFFEFMEKNERLIGGLMTDVGSRFQLLLSDDVRAVTSRCDIDFQRMTKLPTAFYLSIPRSGVERCQPLLATLVMQMFASWEHEAEKSRKGRLPRDMMCYLDEFANLGYIPGFGGYISTARSSGVAMLLAIQSFSQLDDRYGKAIKENILANTVNHLLLPGAGLEETQYYSERLGLTTITTESRSSTHQPYRGGSQTMPVMIDSMSRGHTEGQSQRNLQTSDELRTMKRGTILFVNASSPAAMLRTTAYFKDRKLAKLADLPFEVDLPKPHPVILADPQEDQKVTEPKITPRIVMEPLSSLVRPQGGETGQEQELRELEIEEEEAETAPVHDTDIAPE
jgi:type IV secretion system protein VirD4